MTNACAPSIVEYDDCLHHDRSGHSEVALEKPAAELLPCSKRTQPFFIQETALGDVSRAPMDRAAEHVHA